VGADFEDDSDMLRSYCPVGMSGGEDMFKIHRPVQILDEEMARAAQGASRMARTGRDNTRIGRSVRRCPIRRSDAVVPINTSRLFDVVGDNSLCWESHPSGMKRWGIFCVSDS